MVVFCVSDLRSLSERSSKLTKFAPRANLLFYKKESRDSKILYGHPSSRAR